MKKLHFETIINASPEKVWEAIVDKKSYEEWTSVFGEGSSFEGGWNEGDKIRFVSVDKENRKEGMLGEIAESRKPEYISIRMLGMISNGVEDTESPGVTSWLPAYENYTFTKVGDTTEFSVDVETANEYADMFSEMWPKALEILKKIAER